MINLASLTEPGPFRDHTANLGAGSWGFASMAASLQWLVNDCPGRLPGSECRLHTLTSAALAMLRLLSPQSRATFIPRAVYHS
jgi:hypothetical protein